MVIIKKFSTLLVCFLFGLSLAACSGGGGSGGGQGTLSTSLTDSSGEFEAVYVTIARVDVHHDSDGSWETVAEPGKTYNLLELVNGVRETLGMATLDAGHYTQMRLIIGETADDGINIQSVPHPYANYVIDKETFVIHELKVPSGTNTGLKIVNGFDINENQTTELILDFDASRSVVIAGSSGKYLLKPTIKVRNTEEYAIVSGTVSDDSAALQAGALVTAQTTDPSADDVKDKVVIEAGTVANESSYYALFLAPGDYNLVATQPSYLPDCIPVTLLENDKPEVNFLVATAEGMGEVNGTVTIEVSPGDQYATIDFRKPADCGGVEKMITVKTINIGDGGTYSVNLPYSANVAENDYTVVASTYGKFTKSGTVTVGSEPVTNDINF